MSRRSKATGGKVEITVEGYINIYQDTTGKIYHATILHDTKESAIKQASPIGYQDTVYVCQTFKADTTKPDIKEGEE